MKARVPYLIEDSTSIVFFFFVFLFSGSLVGSSERVWRLNKQFIQVACHANRGQCSSAGSWLGTFVDPESIHVKLDSLPGSIPVPFCGKYQAHHYDYHCLLFLCQVYPATHEHRTHLIWAIGSQTHFVPGHQEGSAKGAGDRKE